MLTIEQFIHQNRAAFDSATPDERVWKGVENALDGADGLEKFILENRAQFDVAMPSEAVWAGMEASGKLGDCALESFLSDHREALDTASPSERVWVKIEKLLRPQLQVVHSNLGQRLLRAAAAIALLITCFGAGMWYARSGQDEEVAMTMSEVSGEYRELEDFYKRDIAVKQEKLTTFAANRPEPVLEDLHQLDKVMEELQQELAQAPPGNREQVVRAMIQNYKAKMAILEKVLEHMQDQNHHQEQSNSFKNGIKNI